MICPFCSVEMHPVPDDRGLPGGGGNRMWYYDEDRQHHSVQAASCPGCRGVFLLHSDIYSHPTNIAAGEARAEESNVFVLLPRTSSRKALPSEVPEPYRSLYSEAALILADSPRASAALSRRCLQHLLREVAGAPKSDLYREIEWILNNAQLPGYVTESLHDLRAIGNMATHPNKSTATGEHLEVEPGEAEWTLDTLDALFSHLFVEPAKTAARKAALAAKSGPSAK